LARTRGAKVAPLPAVVSGPTIVTYASGASAELLVGGASSVAAVDAFAGVDAVATTTSFPAFVTSARCFGALGDAPAIAALEGGARIHVFLTDVSKLSFAVYVVPTLVSCHLLQTIFVSEKIVWHCSAPVAGDLSTIEPHEASFPLRSDVPSIIPRRENRLKSSKESNTDNGFERIILNMLASKSISLVRLSIGQHSAFTLALFRRP